MSAVARRPSPPAAHPAPPPPPAAVAAPVSMMDLSRACTEAGADMGTRHGDTRRSWALLQAGIFIERLLPLRDRLRQWAGAVTAGSIDRTDRARCAVPGAIGRTANEPPPSLGDMALACSDAGFTLQASGILATRARGDLLRRAAIFLDRLHPLLDLICKHLAPRDRGAVQRSAS